MNSTMVVAAIGISALAAALFFIYNYLGWITALVVTVGTIYVVRQYRIPTTRTEPSASLIALAFVTLVMLVFGVFVEQGVSALVLYSKSYVDLTLATPFGTLILAPNVFLMLTCLMVIISTPIITGALLHLEKRGVNVAPGLLMSIGVGIMSASFLLVALAAFLPREGLASAWWMVGVYIMSALAELFLFPAAFSVMTRSIPSDKINAITGIWFLSFAVSGFIAHRAAIYVSMSDSGIVPTTDNFVQYFIVLGAIGFMVVACLETARLVFRKTGRVKI